MKNINKIIKWITIRLMQRMLNMALKDKSTVDNIIIEKAVNNMIKNYKDTIMYIRADI